MKNLIYLFAAVTMFAFTACGGGEATTEEATPAATEEVVTDATVEEVAEAVGCQVEGGTCLEDHSCCAAKPVAACCCGDETCDGSCHGDAAEAEAAHTHE